MAATPIIARHEAVKIRIARKQTLPPWKFLVPKNYGWTNIIDTWIRESGNFTPNTIRYAGLITVNSQLTKDLTTKIIEANPMLKSRYIKNQHVLREGDTIQIPHELKNNSVLNTVIKRINDNIQLLTSNITLTPTNLMIKFPPGYTLKKFEEWLEFAFIDNLPKAYKHDSVFLRNPKNILKYAPYMFASGQRHNINPQVMAALILKESVFDRYAQNPSTLATGLTQVKPKVARRILSKVAIHNKHGDIFNILKNPQSSIEIGTYHLAQQLEIAGDHPLAALAIYYRGMGSFTREKLDTSITYAKDIVSFYDTAPSIDFLDPEIQYVNGIPSELFWQRFNR